VARTRFARSRAPCLTEPATCHRPHTYRGPDPAGTAASVDASRRPSPSARGGGLVDMREDGANAKPNARSVTYAPAMVSAGLTRRTCPGVALVPPQERGTAVTRRHEKSRLSVKGIFHTERSAERPGEEGRRSKTRAGSFLLCRTQCGDGCERDIGQASTSTPQTTRACGRGSRKSCCIGRLLGGE
jgi:hypothetical protein